MAITYNAGTNIITVIGYTEGTPCNFTDIYNADKAGTLSLHARTGIAGTDGAAVATDRAERPVDYIVLGGASNDLYITVANWNGTTATIRITGTDRDGTAQTEDIIVNANGQYNTTKWFKTITHTRVTAFAATSFDYDLTQGQWGVVWKQSTNQYVFDAQVYIGEGSTTTWFVDNLKQVYWNSIFTAHYQWGLRGHLLSHINLKKCGLFVYENTYRVLFGGVELGDRSPDLKFELCLIYGLQVQYSHRIQGVAGGYIKSCNLINFGLDFVFDTDIDNVTINIDPGGSTTVAFAGVTGGTVNDLYISRGERAITNYYAYGGTFRNVKMRNIDNDDILNHTITTPIYFVNPDFEHEPWRVVWWGACTANMYRQYEFDLKVIDKNTAAINGATVKIWDKDNTLVVDTTTNASGVIATQTITRGYYNQTNGNTLQEASPHLIKIEKAGYTLYEADFTLEEKTDWLIALQTSILRNPSMTGGMS